MVIPDGPAHWPVNVSISTIIHMDRVDRHLIHDDF